MQVNCLHLFKLWSYVNKELYHISILISIKDILHSFHFYACFITRIILSSCFNIQILINCLCNRIYIYFLIYSIIVQFDEHLFNNVNLRSYSKHDRNTFDTQGEVMTITTLNIFKTTKGREKFI